MAKVKGPRKLFEKVYLGWCFPDVLGATRKFCCPNSTYSQENQRAPLNQMFESKSGDCFENRESTKCYKHIRIYFVPRDWLFSHHRLQYFFLFLVQHPLELKIHHPHPIERSY